MTYSHTTVVTDDEFVLFLVRHADVAHLIIKIFFSFFPVEFIILGDALLLWRDFDYLRRGGERDSEGGVAVVFAKNGEEFRATHGTFIGDFRPAEDAG